MLTVFKTNDERLDLEGKVLAAAFKQSFEMGDSAGAQLAHKGLCYILQVRLFGGQAMPGMPTMPGMPAMPGMPPLPGAPAMPAMPDMAGSPGMPTIPEKAVQSPATDEPVPVNSSASDEKTKAEPTAGTSSADNSPTVARKDFSEPETAASTTDSDSIEPLASVSVPSSLSTALAHASESDKSDKKDSAGSKVPKSLRKAIVDAATEGESEKSPAEPPVAAVESPAKDEVDTDEHEILTGEEEVIRPGEEVKLTGTTGNTTSFEPASGEAVPQEQAYEHFVAPGNSTPEGALAFEPTLEPIDLHPLVESQDQPVETLPNQQQALDRQQEAQAPVGEQRDGADTDLTPHSELPPGGPSTYLDFDEPAAQNNGDAPAAPAAVPPMVAIDDFSSSQVTPVEPMPVFTAPTAEVPPPAAPAPKLSPSQLIKTQTYYQMLSVNQLSSFEEIHTRFFRRIKRLLRSRAASEMARENIREFKEVLRAICIAHDVLKDPVTRTDYDLRMMGMRTAPEQIATPADPKPQFGNRTRLMLGELLECAGMLQGSELEIALDMHKAEPGVLFGEFLVKAGFLNQEELDATLMAQKLISSGRITVAQFQTAINQMRYHGISFFDTLMTEGWLQPKDIFDEQSELWQALAMPSNPPAAQPAEQPAAPVENVPPPAPEAVPPAATNNGDNTPVVGLPVINPTPSEPPLAEVAATATTEEGWVTDTPETAEQQQRVSKPSRKTRERARPAAAARAQESFPEGWTEKDACAETQTIDLSAFRAAMKRAEEEE